MDKKIINILDWGIFVLLSLICCDISGKGLINTAFWVVGICSAIPEILINMPLSFILIFIYLIGLYLLYSIYYKYTLNRDIRNFIIYLKTNHIVQICYFIIMVLLSFFISYYVIFPFEINTVIIIFIMYLFWYAEKWKIVQCIINKINDFKITQIIFLLLKYTIGIMAIMYWGILSIIAFTELKNGIIAWWVATKIVL